MSRVTSTPSRAAFNGMLNRRPEVVARLLDIDYPIAAAEYAGEAELPISFRGGSHGVAGLCVVSFSPESAPQRRATSRQAARAPSSCVSGTPEKAYKPLPIVELGGPESPVAIPLVQGGRYVHSHA